jgi:flagellar P-ring protein precursor FlgI
MSCSRRSAAVVLLLLAGALVATAAPEVRVKDIAYLRGLRANQVLGIGLVTGLAGKGDSAASGLLKTTLASLVSTFGVDVPAADVRSKKCAVVMVSAELPALAKVGDRTTRPSRASATRATSTGACCCRPRSSPRTGRPTRSRRGGF